MRKLREKLSGRLRVKEGHKWPWKHRKRPAELEGDYPSWFRLEDSTSGPNDDFATPSAHLPGANTGVTDDQEIENNSADASTDSAGLADFMITNDDQIWRKDDYDATRDPMAPISSVWTPETCACRALTGEIPSTAKRRAAMTKREDMGNSVSNGWPISMSLQSLRRGEKHSCPTCIILCAVIWHPAVSAIWDLTGRERNWPWNSMVHFLNPKGNFGINQHPDPTAENMMEFDMLRAADREPQSEVFSKINILQHTTSSDGTLVEIKSWLNQCRNTHKICSRSRPEGFPARLLDLSQAGLVKLVEVNSATRKEYACLSYCWGTVVQVKLLRSNYGDVVHGLRLHDLSQTFRDAIGTCQRLGISFIWIDALCIIQDDPRDWNAESVKMAAIYGGAVVTLAASHAGDSQGGCFHDQRRTTYDIKIGGLPLGLFVREGEQHQSFVRDLYWNFDSAFPSENPDALLLRGWTLQERLLSRRVVHFSFDEVIWECAELTDCECGRIKYQDYDSTKRELHQIITLQSSARMNQFWMTLAVNYSNRKLTNKGDKLPALAGLAQLFASNATGGYFAGHWESDLARSLLWRTDLPRGNARLLDLPSWSWTSRDAPIRFVMHREEKNNKQQPVAQVEAVNKNHNPQQQYMDAKGIELKVRCKAFEGFLASSGKVISRDSMTSMRFRMDEDGYLPGERSAFGYSHSSEPIILQFKQIIGPKLSNHTVLENFDSTLIWDTFRIASNECGNEDLMLYLPSVWCLLWSHSNNMQHKDARYYCMVIAPTPGANPVTYQRIGIGSGRVERWMPKVLFEGEEAMGDYFDDAESRDFTMV